MAEQTGPCPHAWELSTQRLMEPSAQHPPAALGFGLRSIWLFLVGQFSLLAGSSKEVKAFYQLVIIEFLIPCLPPSSLPTLYAPDTFIHSCNKYLSVYYVPDQGALAHYRLERTRGGAITGAWGEW